MTNQEIILKAIQLERGKQDGKWGAINKRMIPKLPTVLMEEVGEVARAVLEKDHDNLQYELVQVASVCVKWLEIILISDSPSIKNGKEKA